MDKKTVSRVDIISQLGERSKLPRTDIVNCVETLLDLMVDTLKSGQGIKIPHFGTFNVRHKSARPGRNPRTGEPVEITPRRVVTFRLSLALCNQTKKKSDPNNSGTTNLAKKKSSSAV